jgi:hypothetical protein
VEAVAEDFAHCRSTPPGDAMALQRVGKEPAHRPCGPVLWAYLVGRPGLEPGTFGSKVSEKCFHGSSTFIEIGRDLRQPERVLGIGPGWFGLVGGITLVHSPQCQCLQVVLVGTPEQPRKRPGAARSPTTPRILQAARA